MGANHTIGEGCQGMICGNRIGIVIAGCNVQFAAGDRYQPEQSRFAAANVERISSDTKTTIGNEISLKTLFKAVVPFAAGSLVVLILHLDVVPWLLGVNAGV